MSELSQEEIRRKRLARLEVSGGSPSTSNSQPVSPSTSQNAGTFLLPTPPPITINRETPPPQKSDSQSTDTSSQMEVEEYSQSEEKSNAASNSQVDVDSGIENMEVEETKDSTQQKALSSSDNTEEQVQSTISRILCVSWSKNQQSDSTIFLPETAAVISQRKQEGDTPIDTQDLTSQSLMEVMCQIASGENPMPSPLTGSTPDDSNENIAEASSSQNKTTVSIQPSHSLATTGLTYLSDCYARVANEERNNPKKCSMPPLKDVLAEIRAQCVQHTSLMLQDVLVEEVDFTGRLGPLTSPLLGPVIQQSLPRGFLLELLARTHPNPDTLNKVFSPLLQGLYRSMQGASVVGNTHRKPLEALSDLVDMRVGPTATQRPICYLITHQVQFLPDIVTGAAGREIARTSFLGPFLSISVFAEDEPKVADRFFSGNASNDKPLQTTLQQELENARLLLHKIFHDILVNSSSREAMLAYIAALLRNNDKRSQIRAEERALAGDGFMLNLLSVMQLLAVKVKLHTVDPLYSFHPSSMVDIKNDTRLRLTSTETSSWLDDLNKSEKPVWKEPKFPTQCWFLTLHCHHIALMPTLQKFQRRLRALRDLQKLVEEMQSSESQWKALPFAARNKELIKRWKQQIKKLTRSKACADTGLLDDNLMRRSLQFYTSVAEFLLSLLSDNPLSPSLPLPAEPPQLFSALPEWYVEDIAEFLLFALQFVPNVVATSMEHSMITWLLVTVCSPHCIKNPYLVAKIIEVLFVLNPGIQSHTEELYARVLSHPISEQHLPSCLMKFYTDVETTGSSSEFYDKFTIRYHISLILKGMWDSPVHRQAIVNESKSGKQFVKFINMLMNDTTFLLDESLESLKRIHEVQELMADPDGWRRIGMEQQQVRSRQLSADERQCRSYLTLARETVDMFHYLTVDIKEPFLRPELVGRLSAMLNFNLQQLCGPKCKNLKVKTPDKYGWEPRRLLSQLVDIYLHLDCDQFAAAIAADERSFRKELFDDAALRMERALIKTPIELEKFRDLATRAAEIVVQNIKREVDFSDAPEEFKDKLFQYCSSKMTKNLAEPEMDDCLRCMLSWDTNPTFQVDAEHMQLEEYVQKLKQHTEETLDIMDESEANYFEVIRFETDLMLQWSVLDNLKRLRVLAVLRGETEVESSARVIPGIPNDGALVQLQSSCVKRDLTLTMSAPLIQAFQASRPLMLSSQLSCGPAASSALVPVNYWDSNKFETPLSDEVNPEVLKPAAPIMAFQASRPLMLSSQLSCGPATSNALVPVNYLDSNKFETPLSDDVNPEVLKPAAPIMEKPSMWRRFVRFWRNCICCIPVTRQESRK